MFERRIEYYVRSFRSDRSKGRSKGIEKGAELLAKLIRILMPGSKDYEEALNGNNETRKELYKKYNIE